MPNLCIVPARALEDRSLTPRDLRALMAVGLYTNHAGKGVWASQTTLAERSGMSRQQMSASLARLEEKGYITKTRRRNEKGAELTCIIDIILGETPPVPKSGTLPVPKVGTQTTQENDPTTAQRSAHAILDLLTTEKRDAVTEWLDGATFPDRLERAAAGLPFPPEVIATALYEMAVADARRSVRAMTAFCAGVVQGPPVRASGGKLGGKVGALRERLKLQENV